MKIKRARICFLFTFFSCCGEVFEECVFISWNGRAAGVISRWDGIEMMNMRPARCVSGKPSFFHTYNVLVKGLYVKRSQDLSAESTAQCS